MKNTPENITTLEPNQIFVFGSNLAGIHGAGAAALAHKKFGAEMRIGVGITGQCYAIPTKDHFIKTMALGQIRPYATAFLKYAARHPEKEFLVTKIGCGLAGYTSTDIAPMFVGAGTNVILPEEFALILKGAV